MDTIYTYYNVNLSKNSAVALGYRGQRWFNKNAESDVNGVICIRTERPPIGTKGKQVYKVSYSFCSPKDNFNRRIARNIASGRNKITIESDTPLKAGEISEKALNIITNGDTSVINLPKWLDGAQRITPRVRSRGK